MRYAIGWPVLLVVFGVLVEAFKVALHGGTDYDIPTTPSPERRPTPSAGGRNERQTLRALRQRAVLSVHWRDGQRPRHLRVCVQGPATRLHAG